VLLGVEKGGVHRPCSENSWQRYQDHKIERYANAVFRFISASA
jgi:hypothetical protein